MKSFSIKEYGLTYLIIAASAFSIGLSVEWGAYGKVLGNAIVICLDCIGLI